jgi:hypothetical protein
MICEVVLMAEKASHATIRVQFGRGSGLPNLDV